MCTRIVNKGLGLDEFRRYNIIDLEAIGFLVQPTSFILENLRQFFIERHRGTQSAR